MKLSLRHFYYGVPMKAKNVATKNLVKTTLTLMFFTVALASLDPPKVDLTAIKCRPGYQ